jgi:phospholipid/cholesterol/gamma-HCH transport system substrate-binding protein
LKVSNEFKVGVLASITIVLIILGVNFLKGNEFFSKSTILYIKLPHTGGINAANPVMLYGVKIGQVDKVELLNETTNKTLVTFHINTKVRIPSNSLVKVASGSGLLEGRVLEIKEGDAKTYASSKDTLKGQIELSLTESISATVAPVKAKVENLLSSVDTVIGSLNDILDQNSAKNLQSSFSSLRATLANLEATTGKINNLVNDNFSAKFNAIMASVQHITDNINSYNGKISHAIDNFSAMSDSLRAINLKKTIDDANNVISNINNLLTKADKGEGSLGMLINDKALYKNLRNASANLDKLIYDMKANPDRYVTFSLVHINKKKAAKYVPDTAK